MTTDAGNGLAMLSAIDSAVLAAWSSVSRSGAHTLEA
jgi:hypothetical protein